MGRPSLAAPRRRQIVDGLRAAIVKHGLAEASVQRIAEEAVVPAGLVHHYFTSKEALLIATVDQVVEEMREPLQAELDVLDPTRALARALDFLFLELPADRARSVLFEEIAVAALRRPQLRQRLADLNAEVARGLTALLDRLPGRLCSHAENADLAVLLTCLAFGADGHLLFDRNAVNPGRLRRLADAVVASLEGAHHGEADAGAASDDRRVRGHRARRRAPDRRASRAR